MSFAHGMVVIKIRSLVSQDMIHFGAKPTRDIQTKEPCKLSGEKCYKPINEE
jgi:hypothetical protein